MQKTEKTNAATNMLQRKLSWSVILPVIIAVIGIGFAMTNHVAEAASAPKTAKVWSNEECLSCHTNQRVLSLMQSKRGDPTYCQSAFDRLQKARGLNPKKNYGADWK